MHYYNYFLDFIINLIDKLTKRFFGTYNFKYKLYYSK